MRPPVTLKTRREFLRTTMLGGAISWTVPAFVSTTFNALQAEAVDKGPHAPTGRDAPILVLLQVAGGNDGLNTVVPFTNDHYYKARPTIAIPPRNVIKLTKDLGLHPSLTGLRDLILAGQLAVVQGVGYPNPNRSHFRGTDIWATASDADEFINTGWVGRYFDNACSGADPTVGIAVGRNRPLAFAGRSGKGVNVDNPDNYRFVTTIKEETAGAAMKAYRDLNQGAQSAATATEAGPLDYVRRVALDVQVSSDQIIAKSNTVENKATYPSTQLGNSLKLIARWIAGGMTTRVYYASQGGYDTHINQPAAHERLLKDLGDSIKAFADDLKALGHFDRVMLMTFSEFGRRVSENASNGTDHGAGSHLFVVAPRVKSGLLGKYPSIDPKDLYQGDLKHTVDFREVYAGVLERWLGTPSEPVLGKKFQPLVMV